MTFTKPDRVGCVVMILRNLPCPAMLAGNCFVEELQEGYDENTVAPQRMVSHMEVMAVGATDTVC